MLIVDMYTLFFEGLTLFTNLQGTTYRAKARKEGRKEILLMHATTEVDWHVNVWSE